MTIELKIDTNALMTLFPEGSEARLNLRQAVLEEATKRIIREAATTEVKRVANGVGAGVAEELKKELWAKHIEPSAFAITLRADFVTKIKSTVYDEVTKQVKDSLRGHLANAASEIDLAIKSRINSQTRLDIDAVIEEEVSKYKDAIQASVKAAVVKTLNITI